MKWVKRIFCAHEIEYVRSWLKPSKKHPSGYVANITAKCVNCEKVMRFDSYVEYKDAKARYDARNTNEEESE